MNFTPILAEDISPIVLVVFLAPVLLGLFALLSIKASRRTSRASPTGIILRLVPVLVGGLLLFFLLTVRGGAPVAFIVVAAFPLVIGLLSLYVYLRGRKSPESPETASRTAAITYRWLVWAIAAALIIATGFQRGWDINQKILLAMIVALGVFGLVAPVLRSRMIQKLRAMSPEEQDKFLARFDQKTQAKLRKQMETW